MKLAEGGVRLSPTDLANHLACPHLTTLELAVARGELKPPPGGLPMADALRARGEAHEAAYVEFLRTSRPDIVDLREFKYDEAGLAATRDAMARGAQVITQAPLLLDGWAGRADILLRVEQESDLGAWSYEPHDTKLARETRGSAVLQLCTYSLMLEAVQGRLPEWFAVIAPGEPFVESRYRMADFAACLRFVRQRLNEALGSATEPYPVPAEHCDVCRWWQRCSDRRRADDHLSLVANIRRMQIVELESRGITTLERFGTTALPFDFKPDRGSVDSLARVREQARIQLEGRRAGRYLHELLMPIEKGRGLADLPEPSEGDMFFDFEGDPFVGRNGLEYLFGHLEQSKDGRWTYVERWAVTLAEEKAAFEDFVDRVMGRWQAHPSMHIYHYAAYEPSAMKRLMGRHATRQDEVDRMLRGGLFVDLYAIVRQAIRASVERYSIKNLEPLYGFAREIPLDAASPQLRQVEYALEMNDPGGVTEDLRTAVASYNRDDCASARALRDWLEHLRAQVVAEGSEVPRPEPASDKPSEKVSEWLAKVQPVQARLLDGVPDDPEARSAAQRAQWLLAHTLDFHRREENATHWEKFRLNDLDYEDYLDEPMALSGLTLIDTVGGSAKCPTHRYAFPPQDAGRLDNEVYIRNTPYPTRIGTLERLDLDARTVDITKTQAAADTHPGHVFFHSLVSSKVIQNALLRIGESVAACGIEGNGPFRAARRLLLNDAPVLTNDSAWAVDGEEALPRARRLALALDDTTLPIQGPPGSGKTYTGARIVCELVNAGKKVGIVATGHKTIRHFLNGVAEAAEEEGLSIPCVYKASEETDDCPDWLKEVSKPVEVLSALASGGAMVGAGTTWLWSDEKLAGALDVLIVDEAGQISLANVLAASQAAKSVILLGDPQQLDQPLKGSHPDGVAVSALQHVLGDHETIPADRGIFLEETWRLHPSVCAFTSELFYEGRLRSRTGREVQSLRGTPPIDAPGLWYVPVEHEGNRNCSPEEIEVVSALASSLVNGGEWRDHKGVWRPIAWNDVLMVAPYNAQVYAIKERLPHANVGTVDKFQGQEAPIVIYSMATSSPDEAPRGMEFLHSANRLNVATSRAQCACVLVASPKLLEPECHTPRQMRLANAFCRYLEMARTIATSAGAL